MREPETVAGSFEDARVDQPIDDGGIDSERLQELRRRPSVGCHQERCRGRLVVELAEPCPDERIDSGVGEWHAEVARRVAAATREVLAAASAGSTRRG